MKPVNFQPEGRKLAEFPWQADSRAIDPAAKSVAGPKAVGPKATVVVRFVDKTVTFNGRVDDTTVYAEGDSVKAVRDDCFAQLDAIHAMVWTEKLWVQFTPDNLTSGLEGAFRAVRVRTATTPHGSVWQRWGRKDSGGKKDRDNMVWRDSLLGAPPVGFVDRAGGVGAFYATLCDPDPETAAAVTEISREWTAVLNRARHYFENMFRSEEAVALCVRDKDKIVAQTLALAVCPPVPL